jgi:hypothetical protein
MLVVDSRSLTKPHSSEMTCTFEYATPQMGVSTNNVLASDTMVDIYIWQVYYYMNIWLVEFGGYFA